jgi:two-component system cell cycle response regulator
LEDNRFDLIFLDYVLPDGEGMDLLRTIDEKKIEIPVVIITGQGDELIASQVIQAGAYDYLPKANINYKSLSRVINNTLEKHRLKKEVKIAVQKMAEMSIRDELTGLYNRRYFIEALERELAGARRHKKELVLCMMDLDHFKQVNDTYGHPVGDMVLEEFAKILKQSVRQSDIICRYGGEEFAAILPDTNIKSARTLCERFRKMVAANRFDHNASHFQVTISIGISCFSKDLDPALKELIRLADDALYRAKNEGRNRIREAVI